MPGHLWTMLRLYSVSLVKASVSTVNGQRNTCLLTFAKYVTLFQKIE